MKIQIDNVVREATPEEEAIYFSPIVNDEATESDYIDALQDLGVEVN